MRISWVWLAVAFVTSCAPLEIYYRPDAPVAEVERDSLDCEVDALGKAPVALRLEEGPPFYVPPVRYCPE